MSGFWQLHGPRILRGTVISITSIQQRSKEKFNPLPLICIDLYLPNSERVQLTLKDPEGLPENAMNKVFHIPSIEKKNKQKLYKFLRHYWAEESPSQALFNWRFQAWLRREKDSTPDLIIWQNSIRAKVQQKVKVGSSVLLQKQPKSKTRYGPQPYTRLLTSSEHGWLLPEVPQCENDAPYDWKSSPNHSKSSPFVDVEQVDTPLIYTTIPL